MIKQDLRGLRERKLDMTWQRGLKTFVEHDVRGDDWRAVGAIAQPPRKIARDQHAVVSAVVEVIPQLFLHRPREVRE